MSNSTAREIVVSESCSTWKFPPLLMTAVLQKIGQTRSWSDVLTYQFATRQDQLYSCCTRKESTNSLKLLGKNSAAFPSPRLNSTPSKSSVPVVGWYSESRVEQLLISLIPHVMYLTFKCFGTGIRKELAIIISFQLKYRGGEKHIPFKYKSFESSLV